MPKPTVYKSVKPCAVCERKTVHICKDVTVVTSRPDHKYEHVTTVTCRCIHCDTVRNHERTGIISTS